MNKISLTLAGASVLAIAAASTSAQAAQPASAPAAESSTLGEIVVTARRRSESLQEVPQVVNAVTSETLQKLQIKQFGDIKNLVPGLEFHANAGGFSSDVAMRGVSFDSTTAADPTVALYLNDVVIQANFLFNVLFDVGQIEVLRGPQGTNRGVAAPSGAITFTTRKPDLGEFGGYIDATATDLQGRNVNGAINVPIIRDVLGVRLAAAVDQNDFDGVRSLYNRTRPTQQTTAFRASVSFEPSDAFNANLIYQHVDKVLDNYVAVMGTGFAGNAFLPGTPPIDATDRVGVQDRPNSTRFHLDSVTLRLDSRIWGQHLSYIGGYSYQHYSNTEDRDTNQYLIGPTFDSLTVTNQVYTSHEIRLSSDPAPGRFFDYTAGVYYGWNRNNGFNTTPASYLPGAFGSALGLPNLAAFDPRFQQSLRIPTPLAREEYSVFASTTLHLTPQTELTGGLRHLWARSSSQLKVTFGEGLAGGGLPCSIYATSFGLIPGPTPGTCIQPNVGRIVAAPPQRLFHEEHTIYNVSLSHRFTPDFMVYGNVGTSFRGGYASTGLSNGANDPVLASLQVHPSEKSRAYEVGFKWSFLDRRGRLNAAVFRQKFRDLPILTSNIPYLSCNTPVLATCTVANFAFTSDPDAVIEGFDVDAAFQITPNWNISGQLSYADGRSKDPMPCNDSNFDGTPDNGRVTSPAAFTSRGVFVALCDGVPVSRQPYWSATLQSEYFQPVSDGVDAYVRGLLTYYPENAHVSSLAVIDNYSLVNLFAGVRSEDGAWDVGLFVKNAFNTNKVTEVTLPLASMVGAVGFFPSLTHTTDYLQKQLTPRREVGINVRYAFGSR